MEPGRPIGEQRVATRLARAGVSVTPPQTAALTRYLNLLRQWNRVYNLTGIHDDAQLIERHLIESLALRPLLLGRQIADLGTGAGLPGIPLAVTEPARHFTLIESRAKRVRFLRHVVGALGLANVTVEHGRAEDLRFAASFDCVLARAVARPRPLLEILRPLTRPGSRILVLTSKDLREQFRGLAEDFLVSQPERPLPAPLGSAIVVLQRVAGPQ